MDFNLLDIQPHKVSRNLQGYTVFIYGAPKVGKTSLAASFPKSLLVGFEKGWSALPGVRPFPIDKWSDFRKFNKQLETDEIKAEFFNIIIDTVDLAFTACEKYIFNREGVDKYSDIPYGAGYAMVEREYQEQISKIQNLGYGLVLISHAKEKTMDIDLPTQYNRSVPTVSKKGLEVCSKLSDIIGFLTIKDVLKDPEVPAEGTIPKRFILTRDAKTYQAGSRFKHLPPIIELGFNELVEAINVAIDTEAKENGLDLTTEDKDVKVVADYGVRRTFTETKEDFNKLSGELFKKDASFGDIISNIVGKHLGRGKKVSGCTSEQQEFIEAIIEDLKDLG